jgi:hypothetical protein
LTGLHQADEVIGRIFFPFQPTKQKRANPSGLAKLLVYYFKKKVSVSLSLCVIGWMDK